MEVTLVEILEILSAVKTSIDALKELSEDEEIPQEITDYYLTLSDGEYGNNDLEVLLTEQQTEIELLNENITLIDTTIKDVGLSINESIGFIATMGISYLSFKFLAWLFDVIAK